ncbi:hypothetical protein SDC9_184641 [bioreactor metagenome]|uniref:HNH nuclease domain-containing protein n=1 Tax=bioreactor metagenome TaxID=1076179 RepID=A0A645HDL3_9ZZZZ
MISKRYTRVWKGQLLKPGIDSKGYLKVVLCINGKNTTCKVHRLVAEAFILNPLNKPQVNHIDGDKLNNFMTNLEWSTQSENMVHAFNNRLFKTRVGTNNNQAKLSKEQVIEIKRTYAPKSREFGTYALAKKFNVHRKTISRIINNITYSEIQGEVVK